MSRPDDPHGRTTEIGADLGAVPVGSRLALVVVADAGSFAYALGTSGETVIGRARECDIFLDDARLSRRHAAVAVRDGVVTVRDLGSSNGTRLDGVRLTANEPRAFAPGSALALGGTMVLLRESEPSHVEGARGSIVPPAEMTGLVDLRDVLSRVAASTINVLVIGETGVGKELVARAVHLQSPRAREPLVCVNCAALSSSLLESELFGHERGAFTGAIQAKIGLLEAARGGTVFLDEIGEMPIELQAKLLRVIEQREVVPVGAVKPRPIQARFVAATNRDLEADSAAGRFRADLYFRLNGFTLQVPPLRARKAEVEPLARLFLRDACARIGRAAPRLRDDARALLLSYDWPGNVRELRHAIERALVLCDDEIRPEHLPERVRGRGAASAGPAAANVREAAGAAQGGNDDERARILAALDACAGNQTQAAKSLGMPLRTFVTRLERYGVKRPRKS